MASTTDTRPKHALLSASSAHRWLVCTAAPRLEATFEEESTSFYAEEGTLAHSVCELHARRKFQNMHGRTFNSRLKKLQESEYYQPEMLNTADFYIQYLLEKTQTYATMPHLNFEVEVDYDEYAPEGYGTCDCVMIGGDTLHITDYKHGKGVYVSAVGNPQMRLYALGALKLYEPLYAGAIKKVSMGICQPRLSDTVEEETLTVEELLAWGESIKPIAQQAFSDKGVFSPGDHCRFCKARNVCRARAEFHSAFNDFASFIPEGKAEEPKDQEAREALGLPPIISDAEVAELLVKGATIKRWYEDLEKYALLSLLDGKDIPGFKAVEGRSNRAFTDGEEAVKVILSAGFDPDLIYTPKSLSEIEKIVGKKRFSELVGSFIFKPRGRPSLALETDKRERYNAAAADFEGVGVTPGQEE
jgi:hypothetical protein